jgi:protein-L-isoaspartate(D-aspartate) O-methyltransferase
VAPAEPGAEDLGAAAATQPGTASAPAREPVWKVPVFPARQGDRDAMARVIANYVPRGDAAARREMQPILKVMRAVPRHEFVPVHYGRQAYADRPLPIGYGQTISQPYIVAEMTRLLRIDRTSKVLEIGTGSGYQAAVLAHVTPHVYSVEIVLPLARSASQRLKRLGYTTVEVRHGDGYHGWADKGPFDGIIVTCAARQVPPPLVKQLKGGGRMVIPVGAPGGRQWLMLVEKDARGRVTTRSLMPVRFVPLTRLSGSGR